MRRILPIGYTFLKQWERGPEDDPNVRLTPDGGALDAYKCSAGKWTLSFGCTEHIDGSAVKKGDKITEDQVMPLMEYNLRRFEKLVDEHLSPNATPFAFTGNVLLAYNIGPGNWKTSTVLEETNAGNLRNAAESYGMFTGTTTYSPTDSQKNDPVYASKIGVNSKGHSVWISPEGEPCGFMFRLRGLLARHHSEGCISLGYMWDKGCADHRIYLTTKEPNQAYFSKSLNRWVERIDTATPFDDVLSIAENYPIPEELLLETPEPPQEVAFSLPEPEPVVEVPVVEVPKPVGTKEYVHTPTDHVFDETLKPKAMEFSETFQKAVIEVVSTGVAKRSDQMSKASTNAGLLASVLLPLFQHKAFLMALVALAIAFLCWIVSKISGKVAEKAAQEKEAAREKGVQLKF